MKVGARGWRRLGPDIGLLFVETEKKTLIDCVSITYIMLLHDRQTCYGISYINYRFGFYSVFELM